MGSGSVAVLDGDDDVIVVDSGGQQQPQPPFFLFTGRYIMDANTKLANPCALVALDSPPLPPGP